MPGHRARIVRLRVCALFLASRAHPKAADAASSCSSPFESVQWLLHALRSGHRVHGLMELIDKVASCAKVLGVRPAAASELVHPLAW